HASCRTRIRIQGVHSVPRRADRNAGLVRAESGRRRRRAAGRIGGGSEIVIVPSQLRGRRRQSGDRSNLPMSTSCPTTEIASEKAPDSRVAGVADPILRALARITSSGTLIPVLDGLRFVAIFSVVFYHLAESLKDKSPFVSQAT